MPPLTKRRPVTEEQFQAWLSQRLSDPKWVAKIKTRGQLVKSQMRAMESATK